MNTNDEKSIGEMIEDPILSTANNESKRKNKSEISKIWYISLITLTIICILGLITIYFLVLIAPSDFKLIFKKTGITFTVIGASGLFLVLLKIYLNAYTTIVKLLITLLMSFVLIIVSIPTLNLLMQKNIRKSIYKEVGEYNRLGRLYSKKGDYEEAVKNYNKALTSYENAIEIDPYYIEATSNKGIDEYYNEEDHKNDHLIGCENVFLILRSILKDLRDDQKENYKFYNSVVKRITDKTEKKSNNKKRDSWTSGPRYISILDFQNYNFNMHQNNIDFATAEKLADLLISSGAVSVVNWQMINDSLRKLDMSYGKILGVENIVEKNKIIAPKLMVTGKIIYKISNIEIVIQLIDLDTTEILFSKSYRFNDNEKSYEEELHNISRELLMTLIHKYPIQGFIIDKDNDNVVLNIGSRVGVVLGTRIDVIENKTKIQYDGVSYHGPEKKIGTVEINEVEYNYCKGRIISNGGGIKIGQKVREIIKENGSPIKGQIK